MATQYCESSSGQITSPPPPPKYLCGFRGSSSGQIACANALAGTDLLLRLGPTSTLRIEFLTDKLQFIHSRALSMGPVLDDSRTSTRQQEKTRRSWSASDAAPRTEFWTIAPPITRPHPNPLNSFPWLSSNSRLHRLASSIDSFHIILFTTLL